MREGGGEVLKICEAGVISIRQVSTRGDEFRL